MANSQGNNDGQNGQNEDSNSNGSSFGNTPQARDDVFLSAQTGLTENSVSTVFLNVMSNDLGGNSKSLWSIDNCVNNTGALGGYIAGDLLTKDTARAEATSTDTSLHGAHIWITGDGKVGYDTATLDAAFKARLQALAAGEDVTDSFIYAIRMGNGALSWATATVHYKGVNDGPAILAGTTTATGNIAEQAGTTGSTARDQTSGAIAFADVDLSDTHAVSKSGPGFVWSGGALSNDLQSLLVQESSLALVKNDSTGTGTGSVAWTYQVTDGALDFLAAGETLTVTYDVTIDDGHGGSVTQLVAVTVTGRNDAPIVSGAVVGSATENGAVSTLDALAHASDVDHGAALSVVGLPPALPAGVSYNAATHSFTLDPHNAAFQALASGQTTTVTVSYGVSDGIATTAAMVQWTVTGSGGVNHPPVVTGTVSGGALEDGAPVGLDALANASDPDAGTTLTVVDVPSSLPAGVSYNAASHTFTLDPSHAAYQALVAGHTTAVSVSYSVSDGTASTPASVSWTITGTNDGATVSSASQQVTEGNSAAALNAAGQLAIADPDAGENHVIARTSVHGSYGDFSIDADGHWTFTGNAAHNELAAGQHVSDAFTVASLDGTATATVTIDITGSNDAPVALADTGETSQDAKLTLDVLANDTDPDLGHAFTLTAVSAPLGSASIVGNKLVFDPGSAFDHLVDGATQQVVVSYALKDDQGAPSSSTVTITVTGTNDAPVAVADLASIGENQSLTIDVLANDTDVDDVHFLSLAGATTAPGKGSVAIVDDKLVFSPGNDFDHLAVGKHETVTIGYTVADDLGGTSTGSLVLTVTGTNDQPVAAAVTGATLEDGSVTVAASAVDPDSTDVLAYTVNSSGTHHGNLVNNANGTFTYTPEANWSGTDSYSYTANDGHGGTSTASLTFNVAAVADTPSLNVATGTLLVAAGTPVALGLSAASPDIDGSESVSVRIDGVPPGWTMSAGSHQEDSGAWIVRSNQLAGLTLTPPADAGGAITLTLQAISTEQSNGSQASSAVQSLTVVAGVSGRAIDGYIVGAEVFTDVNDNGTFDPGAGEVHAITDQYGNFILSGAPNLPYHLVMTGGTDVSTGQAFLGTLTAPSGSTVVTPLTTLITALIASGAAADSAAAQSQLTAALGLPTGVDLTTFDPVQASLSGDAAVADVGLQLFTAGVQVATTLAVASAAVAGAGGTGNVSGAVFDALAQQISSAAAGSTTLDLATDTSALGTLISDAGAASGADSATIDAVASGAASIITANNTLIDNALAAPGASSIDVLTASAHVASAVNASDGAAATVQAAAANPVDPAAAMSDATTAFTGAALDAAVAAATVGDVTPPLLGTPGNDTLVGDSRDDTIDGLAGDDTLIGNAGNDTLLGGDGNDTLRGGAGDDVLNGGRTVQLIAPADFNDRDIADYSGATGPVTVNLATGVATGDGTDTLIGIEAVIGSGSDDSLTGSATFSETFTPGAGDDTIDGNGGYDRVLYTGAAGPIAVNMANGTVTGNGVGHDTLHGVEQIRGSNSADTYTAVGYTAAYAAAPSANANDAFLAGSFNEFEGMGGNDVITGNGSTRLSYMNAAEAVNVNFGTGIAVGGASVGTDTFSGVNSVWGSGFNDVLRGTNSGNAETFAGRGGNDQIFGFGGFDRLDYARDGAITVGLTIHMAAGTVDGDPLLTGHDTFNGIEAIRGSLLDDHYDATGFGSFSANAGSNGSFNEFEGGAGNDTIVGNGSTQLAFYDAREGVTITFASNQGIVGGVYMGGSGAVVGGTSVGIDSFSGVNSVSGSNYGDTIIGSANPGGTTERFAGRGGDDTIDGGGGFDLADYAAAEVSGVTVNLAAGTASGDVTTGNDILLNIEAINGSNFADTFDATGFAGINQFEGRGGNDTVIGNGSTQLVHFGATAGITAVFTSSDAGTVDGSSTGHDTFSGLGQLSVTNFNDVIDAHLSTGPVNFFGQGGDDTLIAGSGGGGMQGGDGNDLLVSGAGNDFLGGNNGIDTVSYATATAGVTVDLSLTSQNTVGAGFDTLLGNENLVGSAFADTLSGDINANQLDGGDGDDTLNGNVGNDTLNGGNGGDVLNGSDGIDTLNGGDGNDTLDGGNDNDTLSGSAGGNTLTGGAGNDQFIHGSGNDTVTDFAGEIDGVQVGAGLYIAAGFGSSNLVFSDGSTLFSSSGYLWQYADLKHADGSTVGLLINGTNGNDNLSGFFGSDSINGFGGADNLNGNDGNDVIDAGAGNDNVNGGNGDDTLIGGDGNDNINGQAGNDVLLGGTGNDNLNGNEGNDTLDGGAGADFANYFNSTGAVLVNLAAGTASGGASIGNDTLISIENVQGTGFGDTLTGDSNNNNLFGREGDDVISGGYGSDFLRGSAGNDTLDGGLMSDYARFDRVNDSDTADYSFYDTNSGFGLNPQTLAATGGIVANLATHTVTGDANVGTDTLVNIERIVGTNFADSFTGGSGGRIEFFQGRGGNDVVVGDGVHILRAEYGDANFDGGVGITVTYTGAADGSGTVTGGASVGTDSIRYVSQIYGTQYNDAYDAHNFTFRLADPTFTGPYNNFHGNGGSDTIIGNGVTSLDYSDGSTGIVVDLVNGFVTHGASTNIPVGSTVALGGAGTDMISGVRDINTGTAFADTVYGGNNSALNLQYEGFRGGGGNDVFFGGSGFDEAKYDEFNLAMASGVTITMAAGQDINGDYGSVSGDPVFGVDKLYGVEAIRGSLLNDTYIATGFHGGASLSTFFEGPLPSADYNRFSGMSGDDTIVGNGHTQLEYRSAEAGITVTFTGLGSGTVVGDGSVGTDTFSGVFGLRDSAYADTIHGSDLNGTTLYDAEIFNLSGGNDWVDGGGGFDVVTYNSQTSTVTVDLAAHQAIGSTIGTDQLFNLEGVVGSLGDDFLTGDSGNNFLAGISGNDFIDGAGGNDTVSYFFDAAGATVDLAAGTAADGFGNADTLVNIENVIGSRFGDTIVGDGGNNTINGADGNDVLTGSAGSDTFVFAAPVGAFAGTGHDTITDFAAGSDTIDIAAYHFADFDAVMAQTADVGGDAVLTLDGQDSVTLLGVTKDQLHALDFIL